MFFKTSKAVFVSPHLAKEMFTTKDFTLMKASYQKVSI